MDLRIILPKLYPLGGKTKGPKLGKIPALIPVVVSTVIQKEVPVQIHAIGNVKTKVKGRVYASLLYRGLGLEKRRTSF